MRGLGLSGLVASITLGLSVAVACGGSTEHNTSTSGGRDSVGTGGRATGGMRSTTGGTSVGTGGTVDLGELDDDDAVTDPNTITGGNCPGVTLGEVMGQLRASHPELDDIEN